MPTLKVCVPNNQCINPVAYTGNSDGKGGGAQSQFPLNHEYKHSVAHTASVLAQSFMWLGLRGPPWGPWRGSREQSPWKLSRFFPFLTLMMAVFLWNVTHLHVGFSQLLKHILWVRATSLPMYYSHDHMACFIENKNHFTPMLPLHWTALASTKSFRCLTDRISQFR